MRLKLDSHSILVLITSHIKFNAINNVNLKKISWIHFITIIYLYIYIYKIIVVRNLCGWPPVEAGGRLTNLLLTMDKDKNLGEN